MGDEVKLAVVGSQTVTRRQAETAWCVVEGLIAVFSPQIVISGGATGIDSIAEAVAKGLGYEHYTGPWANNPDPEKQIWIFEPDVRAWDPVGQYGFKARNEDIAKACDILVRLAKKDNQSTYGSGWTADRAEELGKDVHRIWI